MQQNQGRFNNFDPSTMSICCVPSVCHYDEPIMLGDLSDAVKLICNNENCQEGEYMHKYCFEQWESTVLIYLKSTGRARNWSEKQRLQNLWTKKGYDLAYKACGCKCGKGHLRKDLDWIAPVAPLGDRNKKKKHRKKKNDKPCLSISGNVNAVRANTSTSQVPVNRIRSSSLSSSTSNSPPIGYMALALSMFPKFKSDPKSAVSKKVMSDIALITDHKYCNNEVFGPQICGKQTSPFFSRRQDYSSFNTLPRNKINSYHIKTENEAESYDEREVILPILSSREIGHVHCIFCESQMLIFDRYPLIDGTFFISPLRYSYDSIYIYYNGDQYLNAICMACLEGWNTVLICRFCEKRWNGSDLILGTMYSYDVIAAVPCCDHRLTCKNCQIVMPQPRVQFFSDYSRSFICPYCHLNDYHFIKSASTFLLKNNMTGVIVRLLDFKS